MADSDAPEADALEVLRCCSEDCGAQWQGTYAGTVRIMQLIPGDPEPIDGGRETWRISRGDAGLYVITRDGITDILRWARDPQFRARGECGEIIPDPGDPVNYPISLRSGWLHLDGNRLTGQAEFDMHFFDFPYRAQSTFTGMRR